MNLVEMGKQLKGNVICRHFYGLKKTLCREWVEIALKTLM